MLTSFPKQSILTNTMQPMLFQEPTWSVTDLTRYLRDVITRDGRLKDIWVKGEISNFSRPGSGHLYFTLKDANCSLKCVMWRNAASRQAYVPRDGDAVEVHGSLDLYEAGGQYQLYADQMRPSGEGQLYQEFIRLKNMLEAEGLFANERKRSIPRWPKRIGIVTSPTGAALRDILSILRRRYPLAQVILSPTPVQGSEAVGGIIAALDRLNRLFHPDVILLARGGGSIEDLWSFNDEWVARAIALSAAPVICGVGHETDFTIADFVSDLRAPTPTAAAELATPNRQDLQQDLDAEQDRLDRVFKARLAECRSQLGQLAFRLARYSPAARIRSDRLRLDEITYRLQMRIQHQFQLRRSSFQGVCTRLEALNPEFILRRGYAIVSLPGGAVARSIRQVKPGSQVDVHLADGSFEATVLDQAPHPSKT